MKVGIIGAGSWGTAIAHMLGTHGVNVNIWARKPEVVSSINCDHVNPRYFFRRRAVAQTSWPRWATRTACSTPTPSPW